MKIAMAKDYEEMSRMAAETVCDTLRRNPVAVLGLPTGHTPEGMYRWLVKSYEKSEVDFSRITTFNLDEYVGLGPEHPGSYHHFMTGHFWGQVNCDPAKTFIPNGMARDIERECLLYDRRLEAAGGIDLLVLGLGGNGHIGFNEPGSYLEMKTHRVLLSEATRKANSIYFPEPAHMPQESITLGMEVIMGARRILLLVSGSRKRDILKQALSGRISTDIPASLLQLHRDVMLIADEEAMGKNADS